MKKSIIIANLALITILTSCAKPSTNNNSETTNIENSIAEESIREITSEEAETQESKEQIESEIVEVIEEVPETYKLNIKMVGDNLIHSTVYKAAKQDNDTYNFDMMFENIKQDINSADLAIINQETIFIKDRSLISSYPMFGSPIEVGDAIVEAGFDIVAHATNHTIDKKLQGVLDTISFWEERYPGIYYLGIHDSADDSDIVYVDKNNINLAFVNYTYGLNGLESWRTGNEYMIDMLTDDDIENTLTEAEENADLTVAILHVGTEYVYKPTEYAQQQVDRFIDNGADIVICAHPHVIEPYEMRTTDNGNTGLVYYSLGNFISGQDEIPRILGGMADINIVKTEYKGETTIEIESYDMIPLVTHQEKGYFTTYKLEDYTDELASRHKLGVTVDKLWSLWNNILNIE